MSDSRYFTPVNTIQIGSAIIRNRFVFVDNNGLTTSVASAAGPTPLGVYYYTESPIIKQGYASYYNLGQSIPVWLELGANAGASTFLTYDALGRGIPSLLNHSTAFALTLQSGVIGDYVRVLMGLYTVEIQGAFSFGFNLGFFGGI